MLLERHPRRWLVSGDVNGLFCLLFDNLTVLSYLSGILIFGFQFPADIVFTRMFPGTAVGVLIGDLLYTAMAIRLARRTGNSRVTAMPLGLDTPSTIGLALIVLGPEFLRLKSQGYSEHDAAVMTWAMGMATMMYMGVIKVVFAFLGNSVQRFIPTAALLGSMAGVGLGLIGMTALFDVFALPLVGVISMGIVFYSVVARLRLPGNVPGVLASVLVGTALYYLLAPWGLLGGATFSPPPPLHMHLAFPTPTLQFVNGLGLALRYLPLSIPFAIVTVVGGINVTASAKAAGDDYDTRNILLVEALATLVAGVCGGVAQTTPYIGHPAYKAMGSRAGYTLLTGITIGVGASLGLASYFVEIVPRAVLAPILIFVALDIVIQSFQAVPKAHAPAVALSFFPTVARLLDIELGNPHYVPQQIFSNMLVAPSNTLPELQVFVALGNGFILTAMLWSTMLVKLIERQVSWAALWLSVLALLSLFGIIHSALPDGSMYLPWRLPAPMRQVPYQFAIAYAVLALVFLGLRRMSGVQRSADDGDADAMRDDATPAPAALHA